MATANILEWEDDPLSAVPGGAPAQPITVPAPAVPGKNLPVHLRAKSSYAAKTYPQDQEGFRYWAAYAALRRAADFWASIIPAGTNWEVGKTLDAYLDVGVDLNAYYSRGGGGTKTGLSFFHDTVHGKTVYSGESPDVTCHELGHAILDAIRPQLWNAMSNEVAAFHESFGDMSAILTGLQLPSLRQAVLTETGGKLYRSSRLSRLAEQLGWAIRQIQPDAVESDCLRNAVNSFFYQDPAGLPPSAPAATLSSEAHSFSRVFTSAFFEALSNMLETASAGATPTQAGLQQVSIEMAKLLVSGVTASPVVADYYSQVAAHIVEADQNTNSGKYRDALMSAFVKHGVLSLDAADALTPQTMAVLPQRMELGVAGGGGRRAAGQATRAELPMISVNVRGLGTQTVLCYAASEPKRFGITAAAFGAAPLQPQSGSQSAQIYADNLVRRGHIDVGKYSDQAGAIIHAGARKTHILVDQGGSPVIVRRLFDCGFD